MTRDRVGTDELKLTHEFLAVMLGVRRPTVTIIAGALEKAGLISNGHRGVINIADRKGLEAASCECYVTVKKKNFARTLAGDSRDELGGGGCVNLLPVEADQSFVSGPRAILPRPSRRARPNGDRASDPLRRDLTLSRLSRSISPLSRVRRNSHYNFFGGSMNVDLGEAIAAFQIAKGKLVSRVRRFSARLSTPVATSTNSTASREPGQTN